MIGIIFNSISILVGGMAGALSKRVLNYGYKVILSQVIGIGAIILGISTVTNGLAASQYKIMFIVFLALGSIVGQAIDFEKKLSRLIEKFPSNGMKEGLPTAISLLCAGSIPILGPLQSALQGDNTFLHINSIFSGITALILASSFGFGITITSMLLFIIETTVYLSAGFVSSYITVSMINEITIIGGILALCTGLNVLKMTEIKVLNMLPALLIPILLL